MSRKAEITKTPDAFTEHSKKTIASLVIGAFATETMMLFFSFRHLLPFDTPELTPLETNARLFAPLLLGMAESARQNHLANRSLINGSGKTGLV